MTYDAILVAKTTLGEEAEMETKARVSLERALNEEALSVEYFGGIPLVGNPQGLALAGLASWVLMLESHNLPGPIDRFAGLDDQDTVEPQERAGIVFRLCGLHYISYHSHSHNVNPTKISCHVLLVRSSRALYINKNNHPLSSLLLYTSTHRIHPYQETAAVDWAKREVTKRSILDTVPNHTGSWRIGSTTLLVPYPTGSMNGISLRNW